MITFTEQQMLTLHNKATGYFKLIDKNIAAERTYYVDGVAVTLEFNQHTAKVFVNSGGVKLISQKPVTLKITPRLAMADAINKLLYYQETNA